MTMHEPILRSGFRCHACGRFSEDSRACVRCGATICPGCDDHAEVAVCASCQENDRKQARRVAQILKQSR